MNRLSALLRWSVLVALMILADQGTKWLARRFLFQHSLTAGPVGFVLTMNKGVAFGLFGGEAWVVPLNAVLGIGVCVAAIAALHRGDRGLAHGFLLIFAGFAGNFIDRVMAGQVTDFLWVRGWSVFNVADCLVTTGAILCGLALLFPNQWGFHA
ncbi:MAG: signal peptidase II [Caldiserica bacterium]|nr:signal peptidase II [Caldisericota bacterium]